MYAREKKVVDGRVVKCSRKERLRDYLNKNYPWVLKENQSKKPEA